MSVITIKEIDLTGQNFNTFWRYEFDKKGNLTKLLNQITCEAG